MSFNWLQKILKLSFPFDVLNRDLKLIYACNLVGSFGDGLYAYLLPYYITKNLGADSVEVGILYAIMSLVAALTLLFAGTLADKYDRKRIMLAGWIAWLPAPIIFSLAKNWIEMLPGMLLWGVWLGGPTSTAYIISAADKKRLTLTFTMISSSWSLGYIFSPAFGGYLAGSVGMRTVFYLASTFYAFATLILLFIRSQKAKGYACSSKEGGSFFQLLRTRKLLKLSIFFASMMFVIMMFRPFIPKFLADVYGYGDFEIGILGSMSFFGSAVLGILLGKIGDRWRKAYALAASLFLCSFSLELFLLFGSFTILTITFFIIGGSYLTWSLLGAVVGPLAPESIRARWISVPQTVTMFASFIAPYIGGVLYDISSYYPFITAIMVTLVLASLTFLMHDV
ncbi:MAG: MFS transporter [Candidatus Bathycorpusculaceae bacterium]